MKLNVNYVIPFLLELAYSNYLKDIEPKPPGAEPKDTRPEKHKKLEEFINKHKWSCDEHREVTVGLLQILTGYDIKANGANAWRVKAYEPYHMYVYQEGGGSPYVGIAITPKRMIYGSNVGRFGLFTLDKYSRPITAEDKPLIETFMKANANKLFSMFVHSLNEYMREADAIEAVNNIIALMPEDYSPKCETKQTIDKK